MFQGRYKTVLIEKERHLLYLCRHVVLNPVRVGGMARDPGDWLWGSYRATAGLSPVPSFLSPGWIFQRFGRGRKAAQEQYRAFFVAGRREWSPLAGARGGIVLGVEALLEEARPAVAALRKVAEHPLAQRLMARPNLEDLFPKGAPKDRAARNAAIVAAYIEHGHKLGEIGGRFGLHSAAVCRIIRQRPRQAVMSRSKT